MHPSRRQLFAYAVLAAIVVAVGVRYLASSGSVEKQAIAISAAVTSPSPAETAASAAAPAPPLVVYACGAVSRPGVYDLPAGSRVADLLALAEPVDKADLTSINLAARLADGQQVVVPLKTAVVAQTGGGAGGAVSATAGGAVASSASGATTAGTSQVAPVSLNTATLEQLDTLQGVGPSTAQKIIDYRTANGGFKSIEELKNVPGIGDVRFEALKGSVTL